MGDSGMRSFEKTPWTALLCISFGGVAGTVREGLELLIGRLLTVVVVVVPDNEIDRDLRVVDPPTLRSVDFEINVELKDCRRGVIEGELATLEGLGLDGEWMRKPAICVS